ncbi:hypothetical protein [Kitasatospora sp. MBT66]|uniref:hypothetical protein n=1 Tax=Kitasatospora sp. MBT66 TaxID=1444769 RepID=UPI0005BE6AE2|nr:hypothetical protein [Kitasatospora sp. MBT66]
MRIRLALSALTLSALSALGGWAAGHTPAEPANITADDVYAVLGEGQTVAAACGRGHEACETALKGSRGMALAGRAVTFWEDGSWSLTGSDPASEDAYTAAFNDGWATAMQDACDQGSAYACNWLTTTR